MRRTASMMSLSSSGITSTRFSWIPRLKHQRAKKVELVSTVYINTGWLSVLLVIFGLENSMGFLLYLPA